MTSPSYRRRCDGRTIVDPPTIRYAPGVDPRISPADHAAERVKCLAADGDAAELARLLGFDVVLDYTTTPGMVHIRRRDLPPILRDDPDLPPDPTAPGDFVSHVRATAAVLAERSPVTDPRAHVTITAVDPGPSTRHVRAELAETPPGAAEAPPGPRGHNTPGVLVDETHHYRSPSE